MQRSSCLQAVDHEVAPPRPRRPAGSSRLPGKNVPLCDAFSLPALSVERSQQRSGADYLLS